MYKGLRLEKSLLYHCLGLILRIILVSSFIRFDPRESRTLKAFVVSLCAYLTRLPYSSQIWEKIQIVMDWARDDIETAKFQKSEALKLKSNLAHSFESFESFLGKMSNSRCIMSTKNVWQTETNNEDWIHETQACCEQLPWRPTFENEGVPFEWRGCI